MITRIILALCFFINISFAAENECRPVSFKGEEVFCIKQSVGSYTPQERSDTVVSRLNKISLNWNDSSDIIQVVAQDKIIYLSYKDIIIVGLSEGDIDIAENETMYERAHAISKNL